MELIKEMEKLDCLFIGSTTQDILMMVSSPPASDQRIAATKVVTACGGPSGTAAFAFQTLGGCTGLVTAVGKDKESVFIRRDIEARCLPYVKILTMAQFRSPFSVILVEENGKRCIAHYGGCIHQLKLSMLDMEALQSAKIIHLAGVDEWFAADAAKYCKENTGALILVDGGNFCREVTDAMLPYVDVFIPDDKTVAKTLGLSPKEACIYYYKKGVKTVCVTLGKEGSLAYDGESFFADPPTPVNVVDTTGAGDNFHGAFLYCILSGFDLKKTLRFCNTFSGLTCEGLGGKEAVPSMKKVLEKM
jgi:sugar/nucleoside kinase (ribokinase family)